MFSQEELICLVRDTLTEFAFTKHSRSVTGKSERPLTLKELAYAQSALGRAYTKLAARHRVGASALERGQRRRLEEDKSFEAWIYMASEWAATADRIVALEVQCARAHGVSWNEIAGALGVSRQAAWERYRDPSRWTRSRPISSMVRARRSQLLQELSRSFGTSEEDLSELERILDSRE